MKLIFGCSAASSSNASVVIVAAGPIAFTTDNLLMESRSSALIGSSDPGTKIEMTRGDTDCASKDRRFMIRRIRE